MVVVGGRGGLVSMVVVRGRGELVSMVVVGGRGGLVSVVEVGAKDVTFRLQTLPNFFYLLFINKFKKGK